MLELLNMDEGMRSEMLLTHKGGGGCVEHEVDEVDGYCIDKEQGLQH